MVCGTARAVRETATVAVAFNLAYEQALSDPSPRPSSAPVCIAQVSRPKR